MPSFRDLARRAVSRALGVNAEPPKPPEVRFARVSPVVQRVNAERPQAAAPGAVRPAQGSASESPGRVQVELHAGPDEQLAEALATIECGAQELWERIGAGEPVTVVDVREPFEMLAGVLPDAIAIPLGELPSRWRELESANEIVCYCASGVRSLEAARLLRDNGLFNATSLDGGIGAWMAVGGAVVRPGQDKVRG